METRHDDASVPSHFAKYRGAIDETVSVYDRYLREQWPQFGHLQEQRARRWQQPFGPTPYYLPLWLADAFPAVAFDAVKTIAIANVFLYHYFTIKDDAHDESPSRMSVEVLVADAILGEGLRTLSRTKCVNEAFLGDLTRYMGEALRAEVALAIHEQQPLVYADGDLSLLGQKAALAKVCASALATVACERSVLPALEAGLDEMATGLQLLDDLQDWRADLANGRFTYPLWLATREGVATHSATDEMYEPRTLAAVLEQIERFCGSATQHFDRLGATNVSSYLTSLVQGSRRVRTEVLPQCPSYDGIEQAIRLELQGGS